MAWNLNIIPMGEQLLLVYTTSQFAAIYDRATKRSDNYPKIIERSAESVYAYHWWKCACCCENGGYDRLIFADDPERHKISAWENIEGPSMSNFLLLKCFSAR